MSRCIYSARDIRTEKESQEKAMKGITRMFTRSWLCAPFASAVVIGLFALSGNAAFAQSGSAGPPATGVLPPNFGELTAKWWNWALDTPTPINPLIDTTGANCAVGQSGSVWFLAGGISGITVTRTCTIPAGKIIFFPVANSFCATGRGDPVPTRNALFDRGCAKDFLESATNVSAEIDGASITNLADYRVSAKGFALKLPVDNIFGAPAGTYSPAAADGYYVAVVLPAGYHTIHIHAEFPDGIVDVTYMLLIL